MTERGTLLVLAASIHQIPVIKAAKALGLRVVTADNRPSNPGHALADASFEVDTTDADAMLALARAQKIGGVIAACTEVAVPTAAAVADALGLVGVGPEAAAVLTDKARFRQWHVPLHSQPMPHQLVGVEGEPRWPWDGDALGVLKPARSSGSKGICVVQGPEAFAQRLDGCLAFAPDGRAIVERFIPGVQGCVEGVLVGGKVGWSLVTHRLTAPLPHVATWGHVTPGPFEPEVLEMLRQELEHVFGALGVRSGPFNCDFVVGEDQIPRILEVTPRLGGNALSLLARVACGVDLPTLAVRQAMGLEARLEPLQEAKPHALRLLGAPRDGVLGYDRAAAARLKAEPWVKTLVLDAEPGQRVEAFTDGRRQFGRLLIEADDRVQLQRRLDEAMGLLGLEAR